MGVNSKSIHLRLPEKVHQQLNKLKENLGFSNIQEYIRDLVRKSINKKK